MKFDGMGLLDGFDGEYCHVFNLAKGEADQKALLDGVKDAQEAPPLDFDATR